MVCLLDAICGGHSYAKQGAQSRDHRILWLHWEVGPEVQKQYQHPEPSRCHQLCEKGGREVGKMHKGLTFILSMSLPNTLITSCPKLAKQIGHTILVG